jgi:hypothetical protein
MNVLYETMMTLLQEKCQSASIILHNLHNAIDAGITNDDEKMPFILSSLLKKKKI